MKGELTPDRVAARLRRLAETWRPLTADEARALMRFQRHETFEEGVARRLRELRALLDLTTHLHRRRPR